MATTFNGYGPDKVTYEEALAREWAKQPAIPGRPNTPPETRKRNPARAVAPRGGKRYTDNSRINSPKQEGIMPRRPAAAAAAEEAEETETDLKVFATKQTTPVAQALSEWLTEETGYEVDERSVYLTMALRRKSREDEAVNERVIEIREERAAAREAAKPPKPEPVAEEGEAEAAPKPRRGKAPAATTSTSSTSKPAGRTRAAAGAAPAGRAKPGTRTRTAATAPF